MPKYKRQSVAKLNRTRRQLRHNNRNELARVSNDTSSANADAHVTLHEDVASDYIDGLERLVLRSVEEWENHGNMSDPPPTYHEIFGENVLACPDESVSLPTYGVTLGVDAVTALRQFDTACAAITWHECYNCGIRFPDLKIVNGKCSSCIKHPFRWTARNNMDPGVVPDVLKELTHIECMLIARVNPVMTVYRHMGNQYKYRGNVINFPQNIEEYTNILPHLPSTLPYLLIFHRKTSASDITFTANANRLRAALLWLKEHNKWYRDIVISEDNLSLIAQNEDVTPHIKTVIVDDSDVDEMHDDSGYDSFIPNLQNISSAETVRAKFHLDYPSTEPTAINEFNKIGYIAQAFPALFPYGTADFNDYRLDDKFTLTDYAQFLLRYKDQRFAKDPRFKYLILNTIFRHQLISQANVYMRKGQWRDQDINTFREAARNNPRMFQNMVAFNKNLKCCSTFWRQKTRQLRAMCDQIGRPGFFFTLSAADYYWPDLYAVLAPDVEFKTLDLVARRKLMHDSPIIVSYYVQRRVLLFLKTVLVPVFGVTDYWSRFEWQSRGSTHAHGMLWLQNTPIFDEDNYSEDELEDIVSYFRCMVLAINPIDERGSDHPCEQRFSDIEVRDHEIDLASLINNVQRHTKCSQSCLRRDKNTKIIKCRFNFPHELRADAGVNADDGYMRFEPKRDDPLCQRWSPVILKGWRANHDLSPILSLAAVVAYVAKYASKGETTSRAYEQILHDMCSQAPDDGNLTSLLFSMFIKTMGERDISAQEVCHLAMGWPLVESTRSFINLTLFDDEWEQVDNRGGVIKVVGKPYVDKYRQRPARYTSMSLELFARKVNVRGNSYTPTKNDTILIVMPKLKRTFTDDDNEKYYRQQCILRIPFRGPFEDVLKDNQTTNIRTWRDLYVHRQFDDSVCMSDEVFSDDSDEELEAIDDGVRQNAFEVNSGIGRAIETSGPIGLRLMDITHDWSDQERDYPTLAEVQAFYATYKQTLMSVDRTAAPHVAYSNEQQSILNTLDRQITHISNGDPPIHDQTVVRRQIVQGKAGTGKSTLINAMVNRITDTLGADAVCVCAPTGAAAININGNTIHSEFRIPHQRSQFHPLQGEQLSKFQHDKRNLKFVIIDEMSMVGATTLFQLQKRLSDLRPGSSLPFGGLFVYLFGDFRQLPPVLDTPLYETTAPHENGTLGLAIFRQFESFTELKIGHRQREQVFSHIVDKIAVGRMTEQDYHKLGRRNKHNLTPEELNRFVGAVHLCSTNKEVDAVNNAHLVDTGHPVAILQAIHEPNIALHASEDLARGLPSKLYLSIGCRVMLRDNLWVKGGLVNGSLGTVRAIVYDVGVNPPSLPMYILVQFDKYRGPCVVEDLFPILAKDVTWKVHGLTHLRRQFPLILAHACTIHKAQGLTIDKMILNIGLREFACGLSYVGITRVRTLDDLVFDPFFNYNRLAKLHTGSSYAVRQRFFEWLRNLSK